MPIIGGGHWWLLLILLVIVLIIWGPGKLPDVGAGLGRAIREFRKASSETQNAFTSAAAAQPQQPASPAPQVQPPAPAPEAQPQPTESTPQTPVSH